MNLTRDEEKAYGMGLVDMARRDLRTYVKQGLKCKDIDEAKRLFTSTASILDNLSALMGEDVEPLLQNVDDDTSAGGTDGTGDSGTGGDTGDDIQGAGAQGGGNGDGE